MDSGELFNLLAGGLSILLGGVSIVWQALAIERAAESRRWPRAPGKVLRSFVDRREDGDGDGPVYLVKVICRYKVGDSEYTCDRLRFGLALWTSVPMTYFSRALRKYRVGDNVEVFYNPQNPEESVLEAGFAPAMLSGLGFGLAFFVMGILFLRQWIG
jgi:hypothetical protein